jgi:protocatechuate 3,4-dioxygenase beta subunit
MAKGSAFETYKEYNFVLIGDTNKNFTLNTSTETTPDTTSKVKISGYILGADGNGVSGAQIIFNVPEIVPSTFSDSSGYYEVFAPEGTYHVNVWPPFDSNFLFFDQQEFAVTTSDVSKNITLSTGYKLSGYLKDTSGAPIKGALVVLGQFYCGWYSNADGRYFVTAPSGQYTLTIQAKTSPAFNTYREYNFVLNGDTNKDFTLVTSTETTPDTTSKVKISGYILDATGQGVSGAKIIFNVPEIVPSIFSGSSGYYEILAPAGTYHVNVWPPFNSNFLSYDEPEFAVGTSDVSKNITLSTGYKLSGYLKDSSGSPIKGAIVGLDLFHCGWYSTESGEYFVTAPAGTYTVTIRSRTGPAFDTYKEYSFVLAGDTNKDFTITLN